MGAPWEKYKKKGTSQQPSQKPWETYGGTTTIAPIQEEIQQSVQPVTKPIQQAQPIVPPVSLQKPQPIASQTSPYTELGKEIIPQQKVPLLEQQVQEETTSPMEQGRMFVGRQQPEGFYVDENGILQKEQKPVQQPVNVRPIRVATMQEIETSPEKQKELYQRGLELRNQGDIEGSTETLLRAFDGNPTNPNTAAQLSYNYAQSGDANNALQFANVAIANENAIPAEPGVISKGNYGVYQLKSWAENQLGNSQDALVSAEQAIKFQKLEHEGDEYAQKDETKYYNLATSYSYAANAASKLGNNDAYNRYVDAQKQSIKKAGQIEAAKNQKTYLQFVANGGLESYDVLKEIVYPLKYAEEAVTGAAGLVESGTKLLNKGAGEKVDFDSYIKPINDAMNTAFSAAMTLNLVSAGVFQGLNIMAGGMQETTGLPTAIALEKMVKPFTFISKDVLGSKFTDNNKQISETLDIIGMTVMFMGIHSATKGVKSIAGKTEKPTLNEISKAQDTGELAGKILSRQDLTKQDVSKIESIVSEATPEIIKQAAELDQKVKTAQEKGITTPEVETFISPETKTTLTNVSEKKDVLNEDLDKASQQLYDEYQRLKTTKESTTRRNTIEQIDAKMEELWSQREQLNEIKDIQKREGKFISQIPEKKVAELPEGQKPSEPVKPAEEVVSEVKPEEVTPAKETSPQQKIIDELDEIEKSETPNEARRNELITELRDNPEVRETVFNDIDVSKELKGKEYKAKTKEIKDKHGAETFEKAKSITNNFEDIVSQLEQKYENFKKKCI